MKQVYIIDYIRTPIAKFQGGLSEVRADDLAAIVLKEIVKRNPQIPAEEIEDVILGCANQAGEDNRNVARMASLLAELPIKIGGETVNRLCASGMAAIANAYRAIAIGEGDFYIAGGVEQMTRAPYVLSKSAQPFGRDVQLFDSSFGWRFVNPKMKELYGVDGMGETAENIAEIYKISREAQDEFALHSQQKAATAQNSGRLAQEIVNVEIPQKKGEPKIFSQDEFVKPDTTLDKLAKLRPAFKKEGGSVTAGNSSGLNDGAAAMILASEDAVKKYNLKPLAKIISYADAAVEPERFTMAPSKALPIALEKAGLTKDDIDFFELNEAFSVVGLANCKVLGLDASKVNVNGGAVSLGHPLGSSGSRIIVTLVNVLKQNNGKYGAAAICNGGGGATAIVIENLQ